MADCFQIDKVSTDSSQVDRVSTDYSHRQTILKSNRQTILKLADVSQADMVGVRAGCGREEAEPEEVEAVEPPLHRGAQADGQSCSRNPRP